MALYGQRVVNYTHGGALNSSALDYYWYNRHTQDLYLRMKGNKKVYGYARVPFERVEALVKAPSQGQYYSKVIKGRFDTVNTDNINFGVGGFDPYKADKVDLTPAKKTFTISGTILRPSTVTETVTAATLEEAVAAFEAKGEGRKALNASVKL